MLTPARVVVAVVFILSACRAPTPEPHVFLLPYFLGNGESGVYLAASQDGLAFDWLAEGEPILAAPAWPGENLTRDPSLLFHEGVFHMVWTTSWNSKSFGYASSPDLVHWSEPRKVDIWGEREGIRNTWAPELHWDPEEAEFLVLWSTTTNEELGDNDGTGNPHDFDHRTYATRTTDFVTFTPPELFYSPRDPELSVIDPFIAHDDRRTADASDDRWVMVIKNEMYAEDGGKNLRLVFSERMQGPYDTQLGPPIVGAGTPIVDSMSEGPTLLKHDGAWWLYWDAPGSGRSYCLAISFDLERWVDRSDEMTLPADEMRHGTVVIVPKSAVGLIR